MEPRYQCVAVGRVWAWRLLGSNHRELARSATRFDSPDEACQDAVEVAGLASTALIDMLVTSDTTWHWVMSADGSYRAASSTGYARRLECARAIERFRLNAPQAQVSPTPLVHRRLGGRPPAAAGPGPRSRPPAVPEWWGEDHPLLPRAPDPR